MKLSRMVVALGLLLPATLAVCGQDAVLRGTITDALTGRPSPCTVAITDARGQLVLENDSFRAGFRCAGEFTKRLPPGRTRIQVSRGFEVQAISRELDLLPGQEMNLNLVLQRRVNLRERGWYAGDSHVHMLHGERTVPVSFDFVALTARAEDLQYLSLAQAWTLESPTPEKLEAELGRRSTPDCLLTWNLEAPKNFYKGDAGRCLGHCWSVGTKGRTPDGEDVIGVLLAASAWDYETAKPSYANFESHALIRAQGGATFYSHPARWWMGPWGGQGGYPRVERMRISNLAVELPLDTLVGPTYDGIDVITGPGEYAANAKAFQLWALLLNRGYRLAATGSSDACFDRPGGAVPGTPRLYTFAPGGFSLAKIARATAAGRTFVTTGPLLLATIDHQPPGSAFRSGRKTRQLHLEAWASGRDPVGLTRLELLRNGQPWKTLDLPHRPVAIKTNIAVQEKETAWYCVRAVGGDAVKQVALSGAFYFADKTHQPPPPVGANVSVRVLDAASNQPIPATLTEVTCRGTLQSQGKRHSLRTGAGQVSVPGTVRLQAAAPGYLPLTLSPFLDNPVLVQTITRLEDTDLLDWQTYERIRTQLGQVRLEFRLERP